MRVMMFLCSALSVLCSNLEECSCSGRDYWNSDRAMRKNVKKCLNFQEVLERLDGVPTEILLSDGVKYARANNIPEPGKDECKYRNNLYVWFDTYYPSYVPHIGY